MFWKDQQINCDCFLIMLRNIFRDCALFWEDKVSDKCLAVAAVLKSWEHVKPPPALPATQSVATSKRNCTLVIRNILRMFFFLINFLMFLKKHFTNFYFNYYYFFSFGFCWINRFFGSFSFLLDNLAFVDSIVFIGS